MNLTINTNCRETVWNFMNFEIIEYIPCARGTIKGLVSIEIHEIGIGLKYIAIHENNGRRWISMPLGYLIDESRTETSYPVISIYDSYDFKAFERIVLDAFNKIVNTISMSHSN